MEKNIKDFIHFYLGCECVHAFVPEDHPQYDNGWKLVSIQSRSEKPYELDNGIHYTWTDSIKPKLRKLESMTEEEAQEIEHYMWEDNVDFLYDDRAEILKYFLKPWDDDYRPAFPVYVRAINWLRSKGFDCDELIESGLAIEKQPTTLNQGV